MPSAITIDDSDVLLAIDLQADFMPGGALAVDEGDLWFEIHLSPPADQPGVLAAASPLLAVRAPNDARSCEGIADRSIAPREAQLIAGLSLSFHQAEFFELGVCEEALFLLSAV